MGCSETASGEWEFSKTFSASEGEYQYKFRLGPGDWWVCDESKPTVDDGFGDRNNVLVVKDEVPVKKQAAEPHVSVDDDAEFEPPTLPHERNFAKADNKRDSLGDDVVRHQDDSHKKHAPLLPHEQHGSPPGLLSVPPESVPINFSRQDTLSLDDDDGDCEPSHFNQAPTLAHEKDVLPARTPTPGVDEDDDDMDHPPLMRHETLSSESGKSSHDADEPEKHNDSPASASPSQSSRLWEAQIGHEPAEIDPNDPSLLKLDVLSSTSAIAKSVSQSSQSPSLPSVREDEEELEEEEEEGNTKKSDEHTRPATIVSKVHDLTAGLKSLASSDERPAALMTPPRTPDEAEHHHNRTIERDAQEEAEVDLEQPESKDENLPESTEAKATGLDGDSELGQSTKADSQEKRAAKKTEKAVNEKSSRSGAFETVLGLGLFVVVGVGAAWLAFMMQDPIKDGGAALTGAS